MSTCQYHKPDFISMGIGGFRTHTCSRPKFKSKERITVGKLKGKPMVDKYHARDYCEGNFRQCPYYK
ncbi:hypothetical protein SAMN05880501_1241 [Ureibacillus xyleni]|uniref:Uncharacterized protein n=1 Tax=Ureibacillus xyleni TaxID=614648 RepID=A0A285TUJ6_9BACL|nr:hypothetical protein SAMN05880501_1241 [Ureibacillus xyleni]